MAINGYNVLNIPSYALNNEISRTNQSMTSGSQINQSADNASGQAIVTALNTQITTQDIAGRNTLDGMSLLQTADGASATIAERLQRMTELTVQALNGTMSVSQRSMLDQEFQQNLAGINEIAQNTSFNQQNLLNGGTSSIEIAMGDTSTSLNLPDLTTNGLGLSGLSIDNPANASTVLDGLGSAMESLSLTRSGFGAQQQGLMTAYNNLQTQNENAQAARSRINDTNMAQASTDQARQNMLLDARITMQAQSNQQQASVLQLLNS
ncbi:flagellin [Thiomicrorhabdus xiamenensis]|uniref:Flagellin n=1 Tax=Thiomicrorhabdus xiamenensis TaxID=2739063 RepID=A0A7D4NLZ8_9GAMM|nr:flagellin [Thiomicrorhabdus xiamenensis]QKI89714.1 flagellin-like protein [Thiomicrorhabdus xiamenensis]